MIAMALACEPKLLIADHAERLALIDVQRHAVDGVHHAILELDLGAQVGDF
jgi:ABC-type dipeptide/oligopeptide/nickel transport system ATPase component